MASSTRHLCFLFKRAHGDRDYDSIDPCSVCDNVTGLLFITVAGEFVIHIVVRWAAMVSSGTWLSYQRRGSWRIQYCSASHQTCLYLGRRQDFLLQGIFQPSLRSLIRMAAHKCTKGHGDNCCLWRVPVLIRWSLMPKTSPGPVHRLSLLVEKVASHPSSKSRRIWVTFPE